MSFHYEKDAIHMQIRRAVKHSLIIQKYENEKVKLDILNKGKFCLDISERSLNLLITIDKQ